jgi:hypothetical protein
MDLVEAEMKTGGIGDNGSCLCPIEMYQVFATAKGHEIYVRHIFDHTYQIAGKTA